MKKGFTLVELLAVIIILALLALIATPVLTGIINDSQTNVDKRSIEGYVRALTTTYYKLQAEDLGLTPEEFINSDEAREMKYQGSKIDCIIKSINGTEIEDIELYACKVGKRGNYNYINGMVEEVEEPKSFETDSWPTIISNVKLGNISNYNVGETKEIALTGFTNEEENSNGLYTVRVANKTNTGDVCTKEKNDAGETYSKTACGFVIEFADIITTHVMNPSTEANPYGTNAGGWPASSMYSYVNNDIYNALPLELKNAIIETTVVSGHVNNDSPNKVSEDKLYLLSTAEIWQDGVEYDTARDLTRQLDYYSNLGVTTNNNSAATKQYNGSNALWWLRSVNSNIIHFFYGVNGGGVWIHNYANSTLGVAPAFRIG